MLVLYVNGGIVPPLFIFVLIEAKKSLNRLALKQNSEKNLPFTKKGGGDCWNLFIIKKPLNIGQYVLGTALGSPSLLVILSV